MTLVLNDLSVMTLGLLVILPFMIGILVINSIIYLKISISVCHKYFIKKILEKNPKLIFRKSIAIIINTFDYNFEKTYENMCLEQFKIV
jgi:uncharacterized membrane protein